jgi:hypothetical protein
MVTCFMRVPGVVVGSQSAGARVGCEVALEGKSTQAEGSLHDGKKCTSVAGAQRIGVLCPCGSGAGAGVVGGVLRHDPLRVRGSICDSLGQPPQARTH